MLDRLVRRSPTNRDAKHMEGCLGLCCGILSYRYLTADLCLHMHYGMDAAYVGTISCGLTMPDGVGSQQKLGESYLLTAVSVW